MAVAHLNDRKWRILAASIADVAKRVVKVGVMSSAGEEEDGTTIADVAAFNEFGTATIPERSFIRRTFRERGRELTAVCEAAAKRLVLHGISVDKALGLIGAWATGAVQRTITSGDVPPPNAPSTIAAKGSSKPLVDTGRLSQSITWSVADREGAE